VEAVRMEDERVRDEEEEAVAQSIGGRLFVVR